MSWKIVFVTTDDRHLSLDYSFFDLGDAAGDLNGGDALDDLVNKYGTVTLKEIRLVPSEPELYGEQQDEVID